MYKLLVDDSIESQVALYICASKQIFVEIVSKEDINKHPEIKVAPEDIVYPTWLGKHNDSYCKSLYTLIHYLNDKFPCPDLLPRTSSGDVDKMYHHYGLVYDLIHDMNNWKVFLDPKNIDILSFEKPELLDCVLIPILQREKELPQHLKDYLNHARTTDEYKFSIGELGDGFTKGFKF